VSEVVKFDVLPDITCRVDNTFKGEVGMESQWSVYAFVKLLFPLLAELGCFKMVVSSTQRM